MESPGSAPAALAGQAGGGRVGRRLVWFGLLYALGLAAFGVAGLGLERVVDALRGVAGGAAGTAPPGAAGVARRAQGGNIAVGNVAAPHDPASAPDAAPGRARFDIVRVTPNGQAVFAGHAPPGATVAVTADGRLLGTAHADTSGSWLLLPHGPVRQGSLALAVRIVGGAARLSAAGDGGR